MQVIFISRSPLGEINPFIKEQADTLTKTCCINITHLLISKGGIVGYYQAVIQLHKLLQKIKAEIVHVHYGLWSFIPIISRIFTSNKYKIVVTYHGSDINKTKERIIGLLASNFTSYSILVSSKMSPYFKRNYSVIPCGIDTTINLCYRETTRKEKGWTSDDFIILFSSSFSRKVKDPEFAFKVVEAFKNTTKKRVQFIELKGYTRGQLTCLMQAADVLLLCSKSEGSPQVIKEAILNALPVLSNNVGDVSLICSGVDNCFVVKKGVTEYVEYLKYLSQSKTRILNRTPVLENYDNDSIANKIYNVYASILN